jgi:hypothetical protein
MPLSKRFTCLAALATAAVLGGTAIHVEAQQESQAFVEKKWEELSNQNVSSRGAEALKTDAKKWRHAETKHYILHFRRATEARKVARELEFYLEFVCKLLHADPRELPVRGHAYIFEDDEDWRIFVRRAGLPEWAGSVATRDELYLNVRAAPGSRQFNSGTIIARIYPNRPWPLWLNEGFAEYVSSAGVAARKHQTTGRHQRPLPYAKWSVEELESVQAKYPPESKLAEFYQSAEKFVRFLMNEFPQERFPKFVDRILERESLTSAVTAVYGDEIPDAETLAKRLAKFNE